MATGYVGILTVELHFPENGSLKGKRQVLKSIQQRLHNKFNVSVAEVEHNDLWQLAGIAICTVATDSQHAREVVEAAVAYIEELRLDVEITEEEIELL